MKTLSSQAEVIVAKIWRRVYRPEVAAALVFAAAMVMLLAAWTELPSRPTQGWWSVPFHFPEVLRGSATLLGLAWVVFLGVEIQRAKDGAKRLQTLGRMLVGTGVALGVGVWLWGQSSLPSAIMQLPVGQTIESISARDARGAVKVMLPYRLKVTELDASTGRGSVQISGVNEPGNIYDLEVGSPLLVNGYRISLLGLAWDERFLEATLEGTEENSISDVGTKGSKVKFTLEGPEYDVLQISRNYLQAMGPAVELGSEASGRFWVFQRAEADAMKPAAPVKLLGLKTAPMAILAVSKTEGGPVYSAAAIVFIVGLLLLLFIREEEV